MDKDEKILKIRESITQNKYPLEYDSFFNSGNCYAYAIGSKFRDLDFRKDYIYIHPKLYQRQKKLLNLTWMF